MNDEKYFELNYDRLMKWAINPLKENKINPERSERKEWVWNDLRQFIKKHTPEPFISEKEFNV